MRSRISLIFFVLCGCVCGSQVRAQDTSPRRNAHYADLLKQGVDAFTQGQWQEARGAFERARAALSAELKISA